MIVRNLLDPSTSLRMTAGITNLKLRMDKSGRNGYCINALAVLLRNLDIMYKAEAF